MTLTNRIWSKKRGFYGTIGIVLAIHLMLAGCAANNVVQRSFSDPIASPLIGVYHGPLNHLSAVRRGPCPMHPSCSAYARQAIAKHGTIKGWLMATDRLMRCGRDETRLAPKVMVNGRVKYFDPVDQNDFWWANK